VTARLFQEDLRSDPFWMLVGCILVNRAKWPQAGPVLEALRARWPRPGDLAEAAPADLEEVLRPVGLHRHRAAKLRRYAADWLRVQPRTHGDVLHLHGCGPYAAQSWQIFVDNEVPRVPVVDHKLAGYLAREHEPPTHLRGWRTMIPIKLSRAQRGMVMFRFLELADRWAAGAETLYGWTAPEFAAFTYKVRDSGERTVSYSLRGARTLWGELFCVARDDEVPARRRTARAGLTKIERAVRAAGIREF
jgi:hypothetical protein